jgi:hypothetical protein
LAQGSGDGADPGATMRALLLVAYGAGVVSMADNVIKPYVLHGQSNMHPLLALISVLGGVQVLGPIGILVGPMLVAFVQALLNMLNKEIKSIGKEAVKEGAELEMMSGVHPAAKLEAEAAVGNAGLIDQLASVAPAPAAPAYTSPADKRKPAERSPKAPASVKRRRKRK